MAPEANKEMSVQWKMKFIGLWLGYTHAWELFLKLVSTREWAFSLGSELTAVRYAANFFSLVASHTGTASAILLHCIYSMQTNITLCLHSKHYCTIANNHFA